MQQLIATLFDKFYSINPHFKRPDNPKQIIDSIMFIAGEQPYKFYKFDDWKNAILTGMTGKYEHCDDFTVYNVRKWLEGYDQEVKAKERQEEKIRRQQIGDYYQPTDKDQQVGDYSILVMRYIFDCGIGGRRVRTDGSVIQVKVDLQPYQTKLVAMEQWQLERAYDLLKQYCKDKPLTIWLDDKLKQK